MRAARLVLAAAGLGLLVFGAGRLLLQTPPAALLLIALWLVAAVAIHDGLLSPLVVAVGYGLRRLVPDRGRRYLQFGLLTAALVTVVAVPLILRQGTEPPSKSLLLQDYGQSLGLLLGLIAVGTLGAYAVRVARDRMLGGPAGDDQGV